MIELRQEFDGIRMLAFAANAGRKRIVLVARGRRTHPFGLQASGVVLAVLFAVVVAAHASAAAMPPPLVLQQRVATRTVPKWVGEASLGHLAEHRAPVE